LTKRMRFGPPKAARRVSAANQALPHRHILKKKPEREFRLFCCLYSASVRTVSRHRGLHHGAAPVTRSLAIVAFKTAIEGLLRVKAE